MNRESDNLKTIETTVTLSSTDTKALLLFFDALHKNKIFKVDNKVLNVFQTYPVLEYLEEKLR